MDQVPARILEICIHFGDACTVLFAIELGSHAAKTVKHSQLRVLSLPIGLLLCITLKNTGQSYLETIFELLAEQCGVILCHWYRNVLLLLFLKLLLLIFLGIVSVILVVSYQVGLAGVALIFLGFLSTLLDTILLALVLNIREYQLHHLFFIIHQFEAIDVLWVHFNILVFLEDRRQLTSLLVRNRRDTGDVDPEVELNWITDIELIIVQIHFLNRNLDSKIAEKWFGELFEDLFH